VSISDLGREIDKALDTLGLPKLLTKDEIKQQYRKLARQYHPDRSGDSIRMEAINHAYDILMDYIEHFRYRLDDTEIAQQFPESNHAQKFRF